MLQHYRQRCALWYHLAHTARETVETEMVLAIADLITARLTCHHALSSMRASRKTHAKVDFETLMNVSMRVRELCWVKPAMDPTTIRHDLPHYGYLDDAYGRRAGSI